MSDEYVEIIAYADDLVCVVKANTRVELETYASKITEILNKWYNLHKLKIFISKTIAISIKGCLIRNDYL